jgi:hypothetical protein
MKDGRANIEREIPRRRASDRKGSGPRKQRDFVLRATAQGHSGNGSESVRPHLRDQLRLKALLSPANSPSEQPLAMKDGHHQ